MASILTEPSSHPPPSAAPLPGVTASHTLPSSHLLLQVSTQMSSCQETSFISAQLIHNRGEPIRSQKQAQKQVEVFSQQGNTSQSIHFIIYTQLSHKHWTCAFSSRPKTKWYTMNNYTLIALLGEGNGNPLQYSCLENPVDRGAW